MKKRMRDISCIACGKRHLEKNEIGINKKLLGESIEYYYCYDCLADHLNVTINDINEKIEEFKEDGCKLFD